MGAPPTFQDAILRLQAFWARQGCLIWQPLNTEVGAGTMNPATFLRVHGADPWRVAYVEPSVRPDDSRYGENPNRIQTHTQFQVILKPDPGDPQELYLQSLAELGIDTVANDIRFVEDNWQQPALGAWGLGWEVWLNGLEITQFTYFQQAGGLSLDPVSVEITYGLERILMALQGVARFQEIAYTRGVTYGDVLGRSEFEMSTYYLDAADVARTRRMLDLHEREAKAMIKRNLALPAYSHVLRTSHLFNILDARGAVGVAERAAYFARMRDLARSVVEIWTEGAPRGEVQKPSPPTRRAEGQAPSGRQARLFLLEVGTEELPGGDLEAALAHLGPALERALERRRLKADAVRAVGTPRRLVVTASKVRPAGGGRETVLGPRWNVAFDPGGEPTRAGAGFARKHGVEPGDLKRIRQKGDDFAAVVRREEIDVPGVLADAAQEAIHGVPFARGMRWNDTNVAFSRPVRWIVALWGADVVRVSFAGVEAGRGTRLMRGGGDEEVDLADAAEHRKVMRSAGIVLDPQQRRDRIWREAGRLAAELGGSLPEAAGDALLGEIANLVELPKPVRGAFDPRFLWLPDAVLITVMQKHQRYLPIAGADGTLLPSFVAVANGDVDVEQVRDGNEAVLRARYTDAEFFVQHDLERPLEEFREDLSKLVFEETLGSMLDKADRVERLATSLARAVLTDREDRRVARRAAHLAKNDLATRMVTELTSLAGTIGGEYARRQGEPEPVAQAVEDHVRPAYAGDRLPQSRAGAVVGLADRLDSLTGLMAAGRVATSTTDPFALRRTALGILQVLVGLGIDLQLDDWIMRAAKLQPTRVSAEKRQEVAEFVWRRFERWRRDNGDPPDVVRAALAGRDQSPALKAEVIAELIELQGDARFASLHEAYGRAARLAKRQRARGAVKPKLLRQPEEKRLWAALQDAAPRAEAALSLRDVLDAFEPLAPLLDEFFAEVFVMVEDREVARNRLALIRDVAELPLRFADLTELGELRGSAEA